VKLGEVGRRRKVKMSKNLGTAGNCQHVLDLLSRRLAFGGNKQQTPKRKKLRMKTVCFSFTDRKRNMTLARYTSGGLLE
jgi:hypothetical protein